MKRGREEEEKEERGTASARSDDADSSEANALMITAARALLGLEGNLSSQANTSAAASEHALTTANVVKTVQDLPDEILGKIFSLVGPEQALFGACLWRVCKRFRAILQNDFVWIHSELDVECLVEERSEAADLDSGAGATRTLRGPLARVASLARLRLLDGVRQLVLRFAARAPFLCGTQAGADLGDLLREFRAGGGLARVEHLGLVLEERPMQGLGWSSILNDLVQSSLSALSGAPGLKSLAIVASSAHYWSLPPHRQWRSLLLGLPTLESLALDGMSTESEQAAAIASALPRLRRLRASAHVFSVLESLACCPALEELRLTWRTPVDVLRGDRVVRVRLPSGAPLLGTLERLALEEAAGLDLSGIDELAGLKSLELQVTHFTTGLDALQRLASRLRELRLVLAVGRGAGASGHLRALAPVVAALPASSALHISFARDSSPGTTLNPDLAALIRAGWRTLRTWEDSEVERRRWSLPPVGLSAHFPAEAAALAACERLERATLLVYSRLDGAALEALGRLGARLRLVTTAAMRLGLAAALPQAAVAVAHDGEEALPPALQLAPPAFEFQLQPPPVLFHDNAGALEGADAEQELWGGDVDSVFGGARAPSPLNSEEALLQLVDEEPLLEPALHAAPGIAAPGPSSLVYRPAGLPGPLQTSFL